jgi:hypothetical protein
MFCLGKNNHLFSAQFSLQEMELLLQETTHHGSQNPSVIINKI